MNIISTKGFKIFSAGLALLMLSFGGQAFAQDHKVELTPFGGYMLGGSVKFYEGKFKVDNNACYGGMLAVRVHSGNFIEVSYTGMSTVGNWQPYYGYDIEHPPATVNINVNHFQIGAVNELHLDNEAVRPYGTITLGTTWFHAKEQYANDQWLFSVAGGLGLKYFFSERIGIRLQARLLLPLIFNGGGFYIGTGGSGAFVSSTAPIVQGDFTGGLIIALGDY